MNYHVVFDIATVGYKCWFFPAFGLIFVAIGLLLIVIRKYLPEPLKDNYYSLKSFIFLGFAVLWTLTTYIFTFSEYLSLLHAERTGKVSVVEGYVTKFTPMPYEGHVNESFCVGDKCFEYSDYGVTAGFNNTSSHGGPIKEGLNVRVTYVGGTIVKLEAAL